MKTKRVDGCAPMGDEGHQVRYEGPGECIDDCGRMAIGRSGSLAFCEACWWLAQTMREEGAASFADLLRLSE